MRIRTFNVGDPVRCIATNRSGIVVKKWVTSITEIEMYDVLFDDGQLMCRQPEHIKHIIVRRDGVEINV
jgi:hypothetical protein